MKPSVLYFDDEAPYLEIFLETFRDEFEVHTTRTLEEARLYLNESVPQIIVSDLRFNDNSGQELLQAAHRLSPESYRVAISGRYRVGDVFAEMAEGLVHAFVPKPWTKRDMWRALELAFIKAERRAPSLRRGH